MANKNGKIDMNLSDETVSFSERLDRVRSITEENLRYTKQLQSGAGTALPSKELVAIQDLLKQNLEISKELLEKTTKIRRWVVEQRVWGVVKFLLIVVPLTIGLLYLPPLIMGALTPYREMLQNFSGSDANGGSSGGINLFELMKQFGTGGSAASNPSPVQIDSATLQQLKDNGYLN